MATYLTDFNLYQPPFKARQADTLKWLETLHQLRNPEKKERVSMFMKKFGISPDKIGSRRSFVKDFVSLNFDDNILFSHDENHNPDLTKRSQVAQESFEAATQSLFSDVLAKPKHLLHVSCTHYESPSAAQKIVLKKDWDTIVTHMYHMGCYAALPAVRTAKALSTQGSVDILHTEICSLHLNCDSYSPEQLVVQSLFADGAIKYSCTSELDLGKRAGLEVLSMHEILVPGTSGDMTWKLHSDRFDMALSKNVPKYLGEYLPSFMENLFTKAGLSYDSEAPKALFAIHPGGPKIIDFAQEILNLRDDQVENSSRVLKERGNMSSATLPHVWKEILDLHQDKLVATVAFGPGLTMTGALLKIC